MPKPPPGAPWAPPKYSDADISAFKAWARGEANEGQQKRVCHHIIENICVTYDMSYRPDSKRDSDFAEGKRFVGTQIVKLINYRKKAKDG